MRFTNKAIRLVGSIPLLLKLFPKAWLRCFVDSTKRLSGRFAFPKTRIPLCDLLMRQNIVVLLCIFVLAPIYVTWADSWNVELVGKTPGSVYDIYILNNHACLCAGSTLVILDVSDPLNPSEIGRVYLPDLAWGVHVSGGYACVADGGSGLRVIDISDPTIPNEVGFYVAPGCAWGVHVSGRYAHVADGADGLCILRYTGGGEIPGVTPGGK